MHVLESRPVPEAPSVRRVTSTPRARLVALGQLLELICGFRCPVHNRRAAVQQVVNGRVAYSGCCENLLDEVERGLR